MLKENVRICDICSGEIPKGETYRAATIVPKVATIFFSTKGKDLMPTWTQNPNGTVRLDICLDCHLSMGEKIKSEEKSN